MEGRLIKVHRKLAFWTAIEMRWKRKAPDRGSPVRRAIRRPSSRMKLRLSSAHAPRVSIATGTKMKFWEMSRYLSTFLRKALAAASPGAMLEASTLLAAQVSVQVKSHTRARPRSHGINVIPSGRFPSERQRPGGSVTAGKPAEPRACFRMLLTMR